MGTLNYQEWTECGYVADLLKEYNANPSAYPDGYAMVDGLRYSLAETNLFDDMMETGFQQTHNLSVGGGTKDISYRFSFGMVDENGVLASDKDAYKRYNVSSLYPFGRILMDYSGTGYQIYELEIRIAGDFGRIWNLGSSRCLPVLFPYRNNEYRRRRTTD